MVSDLFVKPGTPQANGLAEAAVKRIKTILDPGAYSSAATSQHSRPTFEFYGVADFVVELLMRVAP